MGKQPIAEVAVKILAVYFEKNVIISRSHWERGVGILFIKRSGTELKVIAQTLSSPMKLVSTLQN